MRKTEDKNTNNLDPRWPNMFNQLIDVLDLKKIKLSGRQHTWVGHGVDPTQEKLDRILVSTEWKDKFPLCTVEARIRGISDHTPLVLNTSMSTHNNSPPLFKFERDWHLREEFFYLGANVWQTTNRGDSNLERWQNKIRAVHNHLMGWAKHTTGHYKKEKNV